MSTLEIGSPLSLGIATDYDGGGSSPSLGSVMDIDFSSLVAQTPPIVDDNTPILPGFMTSDAHREGVNTYIQGELDNPNIRVYSAGGVHGGPGVGVMPDPVNRGDTFIIQEGSYGDDVTVIDHF